MANIANGFSSDGEEDRASETSEAENKAPKCNAVRVPRERIFFPHSECNREKRQVKASISEQYYYF